MNHSHPYVNKDVTERMRAMCCALTKYFASSEPSLLETATSQGMSDQFSVQFLSRIPVELLPLVGSQAIRDPKKCLVYSYK